ncbi:MAG: hypothetical protein JWN03_1764 [Nocardia sp.]|uniref:hypothetical protein n=1 Tax=Nocardia sp. TaxID=1821 RepID=UPI00260AA9E2|nr:hypothetical protein [Nocardia sp.]MCU1641489.1 hypothetical protein [Nocardia sp.]
MMTADERAALRRQITRYQHLSAITAELQTRRFGGAWRPPKQGALHHMATDITLRRMVLGAGNDYEQPALEDIPESVRAQWRLASDTMLGAAYAIYAGTGLSAALNHA